MTMPKPHYRANRGEEGVGAIKKVTSNLLFAGEKWRELNIYLCN
jgi:hypothetical protein